MKKKWLKQVENILTDKNLFFKKKQKFKDLIVFTIKYSSSSTLWNR